MIYLEQIQSTKITFLAKRFHIVVEKLAKIKIEVPEVTQSEIVQKQKLRVVLEVVSHILNLPPHSNQRWNADSKPLCTMLRLASS